MRSNVNLSWKVLVKLIRHVYTIVKTLTYIFAIEQDSLRSQNTGSLCNNTKSRKILSIYNFTCDRSWYISFTYYSFISIAISCVIHMQSLYRFSKNGKLTKKKTDWQGDSLRQNKIIHKMHFKCGVTYKECMEL